MQECTRLSIFNSWFFPIKVCSYFISFNPETFNSDLNIRHYHLVIMQFDFPRMARISQNYVILSIIIMLFNLPSNKAEIQIRKISSDSRPFIVFGDFGFTSTGHFSIEVSSISLTTTYTSNAINSSLIGFYLGPSPALESMQAALFEGSCIIGKPSVFPIFTFREMYFPYQTSYRKTYHITIPDFYYIFFVNCAPDTSVSMVVNLETYNVNPRGQKDYLDGHFSKLIRFTFALAFIYFVFLILWLRLCFKNKSQLQKIHLLMSFLLLMKFLNTLFSAENQHSIRVTGAPQGWDILWFIFHFVHALMFDAIVVLIGSGWSLMRTRLPDFQKVMLGVVTCLQILANTAFMMTHGGGPFYESYRYWVVIFHALDFVCGVAIIFPITDSIETLKETSKTEAKGAKNLAKLRVFGYFYYALQVYVYTIRMGMFILRVSLSYKNLWMSFATEQIIDCIFYMLMYFMFRPTERNDYTVITDREEEQLPLALMHD